MADAVGRWWTIRMVAELRVDEGAPTALVRHAQFEDRMILVRAEDDRAARAKGEALAAEYGKTGPWVVRKVVDVHEIVDAELEDGIEIYSAFIDGEWATVLMKDHNSPIDEWKHQNPDKAVGDATVGEVMDAWERRAKES
jgi:hypothetical protein